MISTNEAYAALPKFTGQAPEGGSMDENILALMKHFREVSQNVLPAYKNNDALQRNHQSTDNLNSLFDESFFSRSTSNDYLKSLGNAGVSEFVRISIGVLLVISGVFAFALLCTKHKRIANFLATASGFFFMTFAAGSLAADLLLKQGKIANIDAQALASLSVAVVLAGAVQVHQRVAMSVAGLASGFSAGLTAAFTLPPETLKGNYDIIMGCSLGGTSFLGLLVGIFIWKRVQVLMAAFAASFSLLLGIDMFYNSGMTNQFICAGYKNHKSFFNHGYAGIFDPALICKYSLAPGVEAQFELLFSPKADFLRYFGLPIAVIFAAFYYVLKYAQKKKSAGQMERSLDNPPNYHCGYNQHYNNEFRRQNFNTNNYAV